MEIQITYNKQNSKIRIKLEDSLYLISRLKISSSVIKIIGVMTRE